MLAVVTHDHRAQYQWRLASRRVNGELELVAELEAGRRIHPHSAAGDVASQQHPSRFVPQRDDAAFEGVPRSSAAVRVRVAELPACQRVGESRVLRMFRPFGRRLGCDPGVIVGRQPRQPREVAIEDRGSACVGFDHARDQLCVPPFERVEEQADVSHAAPWVGLSDSHDLAAQRKRSATRDRAR